MNLWYIVSIVFHRGDVADTAWGLGFILLAWASYFLSPVANFRGLLLGLLITIWGLRLAIHVFTRNRKKKEDPRYNKWRNDWGKFYLLRSYFQIFILQGFFLYLIVFPVLFANQHATLFTGWDIAGTVIWITGFLFESIADAQLAKFIASKPPKGSIMQTGLWKYSRHPNYFGEVVQWWGIFVIALSVPQGWITIFGPLTITCLILFVSGVPMLEKRHQGRPGYAEYKRKTSVFIPLPPKK